MKYFFRYVFCLLALASVVARADYQSTIDAHSPLRYYGFREPTGTTATDRGSQLINGTYTGGFTLGATGANAGHTAVTVNGTTGFVNIGTLALNARTTLTISGWVRMTSTSDYQAFFSEFTADTNRLELLTGDVANSTGNGLGVIIAYGEGNGGNLLLSGAVFTLNTWQHVAVVYDGSLVGNARFALYVDGVAKTLTPFGFQVSPPQPTLGLTNATTYIGKGASNGWHGDLQDFAVIGAALTSGQVAADFAARDTSSALVAGTLSNSALGSTTATNTSGAASGGTSPYTYQWYRSTTSGFVPGAGNIISGATSLTLNDTGLTPSTTYFYKVVSTDSVPASVTSGQLSITTTSGAAPTVTASSVAANGAQLSVTYSASVTGVVATDYRLTADGIPVFLTSVSGSGTTRTFVYDRRWITSGAALLLDYIGSATVASGTPLATFSGAAVTNNSVITKQQTDYVGRGLGVFLHFGINTFNNVEWSDGSISANTYQPTAFNPAQWAQVAKSMGATYTVFTSMHHDGFKQWASSEPYNCTESAYWVANYGSQQPLKLYMDATRAAGMAVGVYLSIWDRHWESTHPGFTARQYTDSVKTKISEIFALGKVDLLWTDGWGWGTPASGVNGAYTGVFFAEVYAWIKSLNPNCLLVENSHEHTFAHTDLDIYEVPFEGQIPSTNFLTAENADTISLDGTWFWKSDVAATKTPSSIITTITTTRANRGAFLLNIPPSSNGQINAGFARTAAEVGATVAPTAPEYKVQTTASGVRAFAY